MARAQKKLTRKELKQDPLMKTVTQAQGWLEIHGRSLAVAIIVVVVVIIGASIYRTMRSSANEEAELAVAQGRKLLGENRKDDAVKLLDETARQFKGTQGGADALFSLAELKLADDQPEEALESYREFEKQYGREYLLSLSALNGEATALENLGRFEEAAWIYDQIIEKNKFDHLVPFALLDAGRCYAKAGDYELAKQRLQRLLDEYGGTPLKRDAERELAGVEVKER